MKDCNACGKCCIKYGNGGLSASKQEIQTWQDDAPHIAQYVHQGAIWFDPNTQQPLAVCPWLTPNANGSGYLCEIYHDRPDDCRYYPSSFDEMIRDDCEMIEAKDRRNPKQAQKDLVIIMRDSWQSA